MVGTGRQGPRRVVLPALRRALHPGWPSWCPRDRPGLPDREVGQTIADWGGRDATLTVAEVEASSTLVYRSQRGRVSFSWALVLSPLGPDLTRVHSRVRIGPVRHKWLAEWAGGSFDVITILGLVAGLQERLHTTTPARLPLAVQNGHRFPDLTTSAEPKPQWRPGVSLSE